MNTRKKNKSTTSKRNLFKEIAEGFAELESARLGKRTLKVQRVTYAPAAEIKPAQLKQLRKQLHISAPQFARYLRTNPRTLENWEQGRAKPNAQAALLIRLVMKFPDTVARIAQV